MTIYCDPSLALCCCCLLVKLGRPLTRSTRSCSSSLMSESTWWTAKDLVVPKPNVYHLTVWEELVRHLSSLCSAGSMVVGSACTAETIIRDPRIFPIMKKLRTLITTSAWHEALSAVFSVACRRTKSSVSLRYCRIYKWLVCTISLLSIWETWLEPRKLESTVSRWSTKSTSHWLELWYCIIVPLGRAERQTYTTGKSLTSFAYV